jgi:hypothetical protein
MAGNGKLWIEVRVDLRWHPKVTSSAKSLGMPGVYFEAHLVRMWSGALLYAEDGDLWRGDEERSARFVEALAEITGDPASFIDTLRLDRWLDGWLIHDWLDYSGRYLISKYKSRNRDRLEEIWAKHGKVYGRDDSTSHGKSMGSEREADATNSYPPYTLNPNPTTLNPLALKETKKESPMGGLGGKAAAEAKEAEKPGFLNFSFQGSRIQGAVATQAELTGDGVTHKQVYEAFLPLLSFHSVFSLEAFYSRVRHCKVTPAEWMMLFLDKIHAVYRDRGGGTTLIDGDEADPVAMTVAGLAPRKDKRRHQPTEAARQLFVEVMLDYIKANKGEKSKWAGRMSAPAITLELGRRKGKAGKNTA